MEHRPCWRPRARHRSAETSTRSCGGRRSPSSSVSLPILSPAGARPPLLPPCNSPAVAAMEEAMWGHGVLLFLNLERTELWRRHGRSAAALAPPRAMASRLGPAPLRSSLLPFRVGQGAQTHCCGIRAATGLKRARMSAAAPDSARLYLDPPPPESIPASICVAAAGGPTASLRWSSGRRAPRKPLPGERRPAPGAPRRRGREGGREDRGQDDVSPDRWAPHAMSVETAVLLVEGGILHGFDSSGLDMSGFGVEGGNSDFGDNWRV